MLKLGIALSVHLMGGDMNEVHPYIKYQQEKFIAGIFYNSESNVSVFTGFDLGKLEVGLVTGYSGAPIVPYFRFTQPITDHTYMFVTPDLRNNGDLGLTIGAGVEF